MVNRLEGLSVEAKTPEPITPPLYSFITLVFYAHYTNMILTCGMYLKDPFA
jgi:hypothetical protein